MKKVILGLSLFCGLSFLSTTKTSAQTFEIARQLYFEENGNHDLSWRRITAAMVSAYSEMDRHEWRWHTRWKD
jgi:hypothetical protein